MQGHGQRRGGWRRCVALRCGRFVQPGQVVCEDHREGVVGRDATAAFRRMAASVAEMGRQTDRRADGQKERGAEAFRRRLERGEYRELVEGPVRAVMAQAAEERGLAEGPRGYPGALRFALARLLSEEEGPKGYPGAVVVGGQPVGDGVGAVGADAAGVGRGDGAAERGDLADFAGFGWGAGGE
jgi:hypothetical protein